MEKVDYISVIKLRFLCNVRDPTVDPLKDEKEVEGGRTPRNIF